MADGLSTRQKVAALLLGMEQDLASQVLQHMCEDEVDLIARSMKELGELAVSESILRDVYKEASDRLKGAGLALGDVEMATKSIMAKAFGDQRGEQIIGNVEQQTIGVRSFSIFERVPSEDLARMLEDEHPQIQAVFFAHLDSQKSGEILGFFEDEEKSDILHRIATLGRSSPEVIQQVVDVINNKVKSSGLSSGRSDPGTWVKKAANIINHMAGSSDATILDGISSKSEGVAESIREEMFTFEDMAKVEKKSMQKILGSIDTGVLAMSLKACPPGAEQNIFENLSKRAREMVIDERDGIGPVPLSDVVEAQKQILGVVRELIESGDVLVVGGASEQLV